MKEIKVGKISLQIGKKKIELSLDEACELQQILADLLGVKKGGDIIINPSPPVVTIPYPVPVYPKRRYWGVEPIWIGPYDDDRTITTCGSGEVVITSGSSSSSIDFVNGGKIVGTIENIGD